MICPPEFSPLVDPFFKLPACHNVANHTRADAKRNPKKQSRNAKESSKKVLTGARERGTFRVAKT
jgi:hypothetical protein